MSEIWRLLLRRLDFHECAVVEQAEVASWPAGEREALLAAKLLTPAPPARFLICPGCGQRAEVIRFDPGLALSCWGCGITPLASAETQRWHFTFSQLLSLAFPGQVLQERLPKHVWGVGRWRTWNLFVGRGMHRRAVREAMASLQFPVRSLLLTPFELPAQAPIPVIRLADALLGHDQQLAWDETFLGHQLAHEAVLLPPPPKSIPRRASRQSAKEGMRRLLGEHLRASRDHALTTGGRSVLPRPTMEFLSRQLKVDKSTISRCLADDDAAELRRLWELAGDPEQLWQRIS